MRLPVSELDVVFLSYDEPNADYNYAQLKQHMPWAKRIHGVKGFDTAHKACANISQTSRFITVDGDNIIRPEFSSVVLDIEENSKLVYSCNSKNSINSLCYGNGGVKIWTKEFVLSMRTHENAESDHEKVDFCWSTMYSQLNNVYSDTIIHTTSLQAFRAGFREGVKMFLDRGMMIPASKVKTSHEKNLNRLLVWSTVGSDIENGLWSIFGTRLALVKVFEQNLDHTLVADYAWFEELWAEVSSLNEAQLIKMSNAYGVTLERLLEIPVPNVLSPRQSIWYKQVAEKVRQAKNPMLSELEFEKLYY